MRLLRYRKSAAGSIVRGLVHDVPVVERIAALRAEFRRIFGILRLPAAFVAFIGWYARRLWIAAVPAEPTLVDRSARASPAVRYRLQLSAIHAEFARISGFGASKSSLFNISSISERLYTNSTLPLTFV